MYLKSYFLPSLPPPPKSLKGRAGKAKGEEFRGCSLQYFHTKRVQGSGEGGACRHQRPASLQSVFSAKEML